jgi:hypothetical protein
VRPPLRARRRHYVELPEREADSCGKQRRCTRPIRVEQTRRNQPSKPVMPAVPSGLTKAQAPNEERKPGRGDCDDGATGCKSPPASPEPRARYCDNFFDHASFIPQQSPQHVISVSLLIEIIYLSYCVAQSPCSAPPVHLAFPLAPSAAKNFREFYAIYCYHQSIHLVIDTPSSSLFSLPQSSRAGHKDGIE